AAATSDARRALTEKSVPQTMLINSSEPHRLERAPSDRDSFEWARVGVTRRGAGLVSSIQLPTREHTTRQLPGARSSGGIGLRLIRKRQTCAGCAQLRSLCSHPRASTASRPA